MKHHMSQTELANRLGVKPQAISRYVSGKIFPSMESLVLMCEIFGYTMDDLIRTDLSDPEFVIKGPVEDYQKTENVEKLISTFETMITQLREIK